MKRISNEVKVGVTVILTILVFIWLYNFLKGKEFLKNKAIYYTVYDKVGGLAESSPVEVNGFKVGVVQSIGFLDPRSGKLLVVFSVNRNFKLPKNTVAEIVPVSVLGGMKVQFVYGHGPGTYSSHDTIPGRLASTITDVMENELLPVKDKIANLLIVLDSVIASVDEIITPEFKRNLNGTIANLNNTTKNLDNLTGSKELKSSIENFNKFTAMLSENSGKIGKSIGNLTTITDTLAAADISGTVSNLKKSLQQTAVLVNDMNKGKGSVGQFFKNDTLYTNLSNSLESLNLLLKDMKANPKRYVHFSIFGKKSSPPK